MTIETAGISPFEALKQTCADDWRAYTQHEFVRGLANGCLAPESFRHYLKQDYLFLVHFARAWGLAVYKARSIDELRQGLDMLKAIVDVELGLHVAWCAEWGVSEADLAQLQEARATIAYTRLVLDAGASGDLLDLHVALAPCLIGYAEIGAWLMQQPDLMRDDNPYMRWIGMYAGDEFQAAATAELAWLNARLAGVSPARFDELARLFRDATRMEADFWLMGLDCSA